MPTEKDEVVASNKPPAKSEVNRLGLILRELTPQQKKKINGKSGLLVVESQLSAAQAGIRRGDIILGLNNTEVQGLEQFDKQLATMATGKTVALLVLRGENTLYVPVKVATAK
jgi:serine protease Do